MSTYAITTDRYQATETDAGDSFVDALFVSMFLLALPIKNLAYIVPPIFFVLQAFWGNSGFARRTVFWGTLIFCVSAVSITIDSMTGQMVNPPGLLFATLTYFTLVVLLALRADFSITPARRRTLRKAVSWFVIVQSVLGILQFAACGDPDAVCGTFGLLDFRGGITIAQVYLTFNLFTMMMFLMSDTRTRLDNVAIVIGLLACLLAHSGHQTLFFMGSLVIVAMFQLRLRDMFKLGVGVVVLVGLMMSVSSIDSHDIGEWYRKVAQEEDSPKKMVTASAMQLMSEPKNLLMGTAMGQFGSRAALISSGEYLSMALPKWLTGESLYYRELYLPPLYEYRAHGEASAISQPSYSVLNLFVELGLPLALVLLSVLAFNFYRNWSLAHSADPHSRSVGMWANVGLVFFVSCLFIENYIEFPQAIFLPALLYFAALSTVKPEEARPRPLAQRDRRVVAGGRDG